MQQVTEVSHKEICKFVLTKYEMEEEDEKYKQEKKLLNSNKETTEESTEMGIDITKEVIEALGEPKVYHMVQYDNAVQQNETEQDAVEN